MTTPSLTIVAWNQTASDDPFHDAVNKALGFDAPDSFVNSLKAEYKIDMTKRMYVVGQDGEVLRFLDEGVSSIARFHWRRLHDEVRR
jgi:hypothetical protein